MLGAHITASEGSALTELVALAIVAASCALIVAMLLRTRRGHGLASRLRELLVQSATDATQASSGPPTDITPPSRLAPAGEAAGLAVTVPGAAAHSARAQRRRSPSSAPRSASPAGSQAQELGGPRYAPDTFELLAQNLDHTRRLAVAEARVEEVLATLPQDRWVVQRFALVKGYRIPFVVLGEFGVFAVWALSGAPQWQDPAFMQKIAKIIKGRLPSYSGPVQAGMCRAFDPDIRPRFWYRAGAPAGGWMMGLDWLIVWMEHFGREHGLGVEDIAQLRSLAGPNWPRPVAPVPPGIPDIDSKIPNNVE